MPKQKHKIISLWLFACSGLVFLMMVIGAITRLSDAGLSMVEWRPMTGFLPPLNDAEWERVFALYKDSPEFQKKHFWMELGDFKRIFFWEWLHRLLGRFIGLAYGLPLAFFWLRGMIPAGYKRPLLGLLVLGGLQGLMGWVMVQSGLIEQPAVSHYRLAAHLALAFLIFAALLWTGLCLTDIKRRPDRALFRHGLAVLGFFVVTMLWGAMTAGLDAGLVYNSFPKMGGEWIPPDMWSMSPAWLNFFENHGAVQFTHRWLAMGTVLMVLFFWVRSMKRQSAFPALHGLAMIVILQIGLGIATLLSGVALPLAAAHQAVALAVFTLLMVCLYQLKK